MELKSRGSISASTPPTGSNLTHNIGFTIGGDAEFDIAPRVLLNAGVDFEICDGENEFKLTLNGAYGITEGMYVGLSGGYWIDEGDMAVTANTFLKF